jgi:hypothetical protein
MNHGRHALGGYLGYQMEIPQNKMKLVVWLRESSVLVTFILTRQK